MTRTRRTKRIRNSVNALLMAACIIFFAWFAYSLIEVWNHGYASFDGQNPIYSSINLFNLLFNR